MADADQDPASGELSSGEVIGGKYRLLEPLALGGMGRVWTARNLMTGADVAAKVLLPAYAASPAGIARFRREVRATAALSHRAIVRVFDLIELDAAHGSLVMVMELLRGHTLAQQIETTGRLSVDSTLRLAFPLLSALAHAHGCGIVHRDLKPENVFLALEPDGQVMPKIVDFGISKLLREHPITLDGQIVGTLNYMSPEQTMGAPIDARTDVFSMGVLLYECLSGDNPFAHPVSGRPETQNLMSVFALEPPPLAGVPGPLWDVIHRALARRAEDRFATAAQLADALHLAVPFASDASATRPSASSHPSVELPVLPAAPLRVARRVATAAVLAAVGVISAMSAASTTSSTMHHRTAHHRARSASLAHQKQLVAGIDVVIASSLPEAPESSALATVPDEAAPTSAAIPSRPEPSRTPSLGTRGFLRDPGF